jgi:hypothetical protein
MTKMAKFQTHGPTAFIGKLREDLMHQRKETMFRSLIIGI